MNDVDAIAKVTMTPLMARGYGMKPLAGPYRVSDATERKMLERVLDDMERGRITHAVVCVCAGEVEVWRSSFGMKVAKGGAA